ncbi:MAG: hypothetical protein KatS3mg111_2748 [Pirellulaceae bacterium]|nr:MAG: hypothetical protein KatS3mg111_2748 [Pirellulaceae bacterium]
MVGGVLRTAVGIARQAGPGERGVLAKPCRHRSLAAMPRRGKTKLARGKAVKRAPLARGRRPGWQKIPTIPDRPEGATYRRGEGI